MPVDGGHGGEVGEGGGVEGKLAHPGVLLGTLSQQDLQEKEGTIAKKCEGAQLP